MAKQLSLLSYVKTPNLARKKDSETAAGESKRWWGLEDIENNEEGKVEDINKCWKQNIYLFII